MKLTTKEKVSETKNFKHTDLMKKFGMISLPYKQTFSLLPVIEVMRTLANSENFGEKFLANSILERIENVPELLTSFDPKGGDIFEKNKELMELIMLALFPPHAKKNRLAKISIPFSVEPIYETPMLHHLRNNQRVKYIINENTKRLETGAIIGACSLILNRFYGQNLNIDMPIIISIMHGEGDLSKFYKTQMGLDMVKVIPLKPLKKITQDQIHEMLSNIYDIDLWLEYLPPENFEFCGFYTGTLVDITEEEALSRIKFTLLEGDAVTKPEKVKTLESLVGTYFGMEGLQLGITAIDYPRDRMIAHKYKIRFDFLADEQAILLADKNTNSIYEKACKYEEVLLIEDIDELRNKTPIEKGLLRKGIRSIIVAPLFNKDQKVIGLLEIASSRPYAMNSFVELKFKEISGLFSIAIERSRDEIDNRIEAIIREQYTAIHPSIEWKFIETSYNLLEKREHNPENAVVDPIIFKNVYPLYGQADIVSSSSKRNQAIQADLVDNLKRLEKVLGDANKEILFPLLNQYTTIVHRNRTNLELEFNSNDESRIVDLIQNEVHPILIQIRQRFPSFASNISTYFNYLDKDLGIVYQKRKAYEESVSSLNRVIGNFLEQENKKAQKFLPHYFEKYKTDGIEYDIYIGQALLNKHTFRPMYLRNLRLWQLINMCEITRKVELVGKKLPVPLTTAQLIFAYTTPLSIRFRMDEKQFDVDGAYNVRYEILKKRIDKAVIEGTSDRLTIAGKVAIVYLQEKDRQEYLEYIDYLLHEDFITEDIEDLTLGKLQGVQGLKALRITVKV
jgi:hypothetical protein